jgi:hypothetical protein
METNQILCILAKDFGRQILLKASDFADGMFFGCDTSSLSTEISQQN